MKTLLLLLLFPAISHSQVTDTTKSEKHKFYGNWGLSSFLSKKFGNSGGLVIGVGYAPWQYIGIGGGIDVFILGGNAKFAHLYGDFKVFIAGLNKEASPFIALQPGYIIYSHDQSIGAAGLTIKTTGSFAGNIVAGMAVRPKKGIGFFFDLGYSNISFTTSHQTTNYGGFKVELGIAF